eukprot:UN25453
MGNTVKGEFGIENYDEVSDEICKWFAAHNHVVEVLQVRGISMGEDVTPDTKQPDRYCSILLKLYISNQEFLWNFFESLRIGTSMHLFLIGLI